MACRVSACCGVAVREVIFGGHEMLECQACLQLTEAEFKADREGWEIQDEFEAAL